MSGTTILINIIL